MTSKRFHRIIFVLALIVYGVTAYRSNGYYQADEQYQIIEFAGLKLNTHVPDDLSWEYDEKIRSAIQPAFCFLFFKSLNAIGFTDPYDQMFLLRLLTGLVALLIIRYFIKVSSPLLKEKFIQPYIFLSYFLWFLPLINVRYSSETLAGLSLLLSLSILQGVHFSPFRKYLLVGGLFALSFLFRFQMAFSIFGLLLWLLFIKKEKVKLILTLVTSGVVVLLIGICIDYWYYQEFVLAFWKYFEMNILNDIASNFGSSPWYYYLYYILKFPGYPMGVLIMSSFVLLIVRKPTSIFLWCVIPFIVFHSFIPHKEERFLFPLVNFVPILMVLAYQELRSFRFMERLSRWRVSKLFFVTLISIFLLLNCLGIVVGMSKSAGLGRMEITKYVYENYTDRSVRMVHCVWSSPYAPWSQPAKYYTDQNVTEIKIDRLCDMQDSLIVAGSVNLLVFRKMELDNEACKTKLAALGYKEVIQSVPVWIQKLNKYYKGFDEDEVLVLCEKDSVSASVSFEKANPPQ